MLGTIYVNGISGYVGNIVLSTFLERRYFAYGLKRLNGKYIFPEKKYFKDDFTTLIHCASPTPLSIGNGCYLKSLYSLNGSIDSTIKHLRPNLIIFLSSIGACGISPVQHVSEDQFSYKEETITNQLTEYGAMKRAHEKYLEIIGKSKDIQIVVLRLPAVVSTLPGQPICNFPLRLREEFRSRKAEIIAKNPNQLYNSIIHINDLVECIQEIISQRINNKSKAEGDENMVVVNLGSEKPIKNRELYEIMAEHTGADFIVQKEKDMHSCYTVNIERSKQLDLPIQNTKDTIERMLYGG